MTEKQYQKADSMVFYTLLVVITGTLLNMLGMISMSGASPAITAVTVICILGIGITIGAYAKLKGSRNCGIVMSVTAIIVWVVMVVSVEAHFFYMLAAALFIAQMAYLEKKRIIWSAVVVLPIFTVRSMMLSGKGLISLTEAGTSIVLLALMIVSAYNITKIWIAFNSENLATVGRVSEELVQHFDEANKYIRTLDNALNRGNLAMQDIASNIENTADEIQNQSQKCQDIGYSTQNAKMQTEQMVQASGKTLEEVEYSVKVMEKLHSHAKDVERDNKETVESVKLLNERTRAVQNILGTIAGISTQTHLLALNASVEAARAGDAGKGFAVVAEEIRILSEQTKTATEDITVILSELDEDVKQVTTSINHSVTIVGEQNSLIEESKQKFDAIDNGVNQLMNTIHDFKRVVDDITEASVVIADGITELSANSQEVAASSNDGRRLMMQAVDDMNQVKGTLDNIYSLAQNLQNEYKVQ